MLDDLIVEGSEAKQYCALSMDEMKIKSGIAFDKHSGRIVGFIDLGEVNRDIELLVAGEEPGKKMAEQVLVFMIRSIFKPSLSLPVAHYFSCKLKGKHTMSGIV